VTEEAGKPENASSARAVEKKAQREKRLEQQKVEDLRTLLALPAGRRVLIRLLFDEDWCRVYATSYHPSGQQFAANEGRRGVGAQLMAELMNADLEGFLSLVREHQTDPPV
jgi:hypothetical protein